MASAAAAAPTVVTIGRPMTRATAPRYLRSFLALATDAATPVYPGVSDLRDLIAVLAGIELFEQDVQRWPLSAIPEILAWLERNPRRGRRPRRLGEPHVIGHANICRVCGAIVRGRLGADQRPIAWKAGQFVGTDCVLASRKRSRVPRRSRPSRAR